MSHNLDGEKFQRHIRNEWNKAIYVKCPRKGRGNKGKWENCG
jgi:hypothetical protein